jgi:hypothetical protein
VGIDFRKAVKIGVGSLGLISKKKRKKLVAVLRRAYNDRRRARYEFEMARRRGFGIARPA